MAITGDWESENYETWVRVNAVHMTSPVKWA